MSGSEPDGLDDRLRRTSQLSAEAMAAIEDLAEIAGRLDARNTAGLLAVALKEIRNGSFGLMMLGRFNNGKSTLANALIGDTVGEVLPTRDQQSTPMLIRVEYAGEPSVETIDRNGEQTRWTFDRFQREFVLDSDDTENDRRFGEVAECRIGVPTDLLRHGVVLFDTPGTADTLGRDEIIRSALNHCDAALVVYTLQSPYGYDEIAFENLARESQVRVFTVVNTFGKPVADEQRKHAWNKLVKPRNGEKYDGRDLAEHDIYFVDALQAGADRALLAPVADALGRFLTVDRYDHHVGRYAHLALSQIDDLEERIGYRERELEADLAAIEAKAGRLRDDLAAAARRGAALIDMIKAAEQDVREDLRERFTGSIGEFRRDLPGRLRRTLLPSWKDGRLGTAWNLLNRDKLATELAQVAQEQAAEHLDRWTARAQDRIKERLAEVAGEAENSLTGIAEEYDRAFDPVRAWQPRSLGAARLTAEAESDSSNRVLAGAAVGLGVAAALVFPFATAAVAAAAIVAAPFVLGAMVVGALKTLTMSDLVTIFLAREWVELRRRLEVYWQELDAAVHAAFKSFRKNMAKQLAEIEAIEQARAAKILEAMQAERDAIAEEGHGLTALRARLDGAQATLRRIAEAGRV